MSSPFNGKKMKKTVLILDDDKDILSMLKMELKTEGFNVIVHTNPNEAKNIMKNNEIDIVLLDQFMPQISGIELLKDLKQLNPRVPIIIMTAYGNIDDAITAIKLGAFYYITKPVNFEELLHIIKQALRIHMLEKELSNLKKLISQQIIAESPQMKQILETAKKVAYFDSTVLITGESGTGKEILANFIHKNSRRRNKPFVPINCGAIPSELLEAELFGYKKGAFTGATYDKKGLIEEANGGTVFLDEIGELSLDLQVKLLRVLQENEIKPIGSNKAKKIDVRFIAATNRNLEEMMREGKFREDLYYRLNVIPIHIPPLRERKADIIPLATYFIERLCKKYNLPLKKLSKKAIETLLSHDWKGNIRELENTIERAVLTSDSITIENIPVSVSKLYTQSPINTFHKEKEKFERLYFEKLLEISKGNISLASKISGLTRAQIYRKIKKYNIMYKNDSPMNH